MSRRSQLTDAQWGLIEPLFLCRRISGRPTREPRQVLDGILWILHTGAPWRDLCFGWLKKFRRFSTRYEKLAGSFAAFIKLAFCLRYLRELLVDRKPAF
ncbi:transposase [Aeromonas veronii]|uniref:transposase n=1 Tax=Aeromonas veronii TaxID=654 RepID=UPI003007577D